MLFSKLLYLFLESFLLKSLFQIIQRPPSTILGDQQSTIYFFSIFLEWAFPSPIHALHHLLVPVLTYEYY